MKKLVFIIVMFFPLIANAISVRVNGIVYNINDGKAQVTYEYGWDTHYEDEEPYSNYSGDVVIPNTITYNGSVYPVTSIGDFAFNNCDQMTSITIPSSVTSIGDYAFWCCSSLTAVRVGWEIPLSLSYYNYLQESNYANATLYVPQGSKAAYQAAEYWKDCKEIVEYAITSITFADANVKAICVQNWDTDGDGELSFDEAAVVTDLGEVFYGTSITSFDELQYFTGLTSIDSYAFYRCSGLTSVTIPESVTSIGQYAFGSCSNLTSVTIPESVTSIGTYAFSGCSGLTSVHISDLAAWCNVSFSTSGSNPLEYAHHLYMNGEEVKDLVIPDSVTSIGTYAFYGCSDLTSVTIPNSVTAIGDDAFSYCSGLTSVHISDLEAWCNIQFISAFSSPLFYAHHLYLNGEEVKDLVIPNSVTSIGNSAFDACYGLTSVTIPNSVTSIDIQAFYACTGLTSATIPSSVTSIGNNAFCGCSSLTSVKVGMASPLSIAEVTFSNRTNATLYVPKGSKAAYQAANYWKDFKEIVEYEIINFADENVKAICIQNWDTDGDGELSTIEAAAVTDLGEVFKSNTSITSFDELQYFTGLTNIGDEAFRSCSALTSITIPNSVTSIGQHAFHSCIGLTTVTIPESVTGIGFAAFHQCHSLTSVTIPASVTNISGTVFGGCSSLTSIIVENGNNAYISEDGVLYNKDKTTIICYPAGKVQTEFIIPESVTSIIYGAFSGCSHLTTVTIPNSVTIIGKTAFYGCTGLTSVTIPNSVTSIGDGAFNGCSNLTSVTVEKETPLTIAENTFSNRANATLYVPAGCKAAYEAADYWKEFKEIIEMEASIEPTDISQLDNAIYVDPVETVSNSTYALNIKAKNNVTVAGMSFTLTLPDDFSLITDDGGIISTLDSQRASSSKFMVMSSQSGNSYLIRVLPISGTTISGTDGTVLTVRLKNTNAEEGTYELKVNNSSFTVKNADNTFETLPLVDVISTIEITGNLLGDVNGDGNVDLTDAIMIVNHSLDNTPSNFRIDVADVNGDGNIDLTDAIIVVNMSMDSSSMARQAFMMDLDPE